MSAHVLREWKRKADREADSPASPTITDSSATGADADEIKRLRRELEVVRQERDFLKKAAAYFAKESR